MLLPPGTRKALKSQPDAIVAVVAIFLALAALKVDENAIAVAGVVCICLGFYYFSRRASERQAVRLAQLKLDEELLKIDRIRAQHRDFVTFAQPELPLGMDGRSGKPRYRNTPGG